MAGIVCPYKHKCKDYNIKCSTCIHNKGKRSYYEPKEPEPWYTWYPKHPYTGDWEWHLPGWHYYRC